MELHSARPSSLIHSKENDVEDASQLHPPLQQPDNTTMTWHSEITPEQAQEIIEKKFYPFKKVFHPYILYSAKRLKH